MKKIILITLIGLLLSCSNGFKHEIGDVTTYKLYVNKALILDTFTNNGKPYYKVDVTDCSDCDIASELELED
jgi:hypothetical protein